MHRRWRRDWLGLAGQRERREEQDNPMAIKDIQVISIPVSDPDRAKAFYAEQVGFEVTTDATFGDGDHQQRWLELALPGATTRITLVTWFPQMPAGSMQGAVLLSDDIHGDFEALKARGLNFSSEIESAPWGTYATFSDPDGNGWVLQQNAEYGS
jgi:predicted enzyme related to lactoylglutathione lyase